MIANASRLKSILVAIMLPVAACGSLRGLPAADVRETDIAGLSPELKLRVERGLKFLAERQQADGSFSLSGPRAVGGVAPAGMKVPVSALCGLALLGSGSNPGRGDPYAKQIDDAVKYVVSQQNEAGFISDAPTLSMYSHAFAMLFLAKAYRAANEQLAIKQNLERGVALLATTQSDAGGWRYAPAKAGDDLSVTLCQLTALHAGRAAGLEVPEATWQGAVGYVRGCQNGDGSFRYILANESAGSFSLTAGSVAALKWAGLDMTEPFQKGRTNLETRIQLDRSPEQLPMFYYGNFFCAQAQWEQGGPAWTKWYTAMQSLLARHQRDDGSWNDMFGPEYATAMACIILQTPTLARLERPQPAKN